MLTISSMEIASRASKSPNGRLRLSQAQTQTQVADFIDLLPDKKRALVHARLLDYLQTNQNHLDMYLVPSAPIMKMMEDTKLK